MLKKEKQKVGNGKIKLKVCKKNKNKKKQQLETNKVLLKEEFGLLSYNFDSSTLFLIENEVNPLSYAKNDSRYSD